MTYPVLVETNLSPTSLMYRGKVRDVYRLNDGNLLLIVTDRISAFDVVLKQQIPHKGTGLNQTSAYAFAGTEDVVPNHSISVPDPNATVVTSTEPIDVELIVRGYLGGSALKAYNKEGKRKFFVETLPDYLKPYEKLKNPVVTPTTKAKTGHDKPIETMEDFIAFVGNEKRAYDLIEKAVALYQKGDEMAGQNGGSLFDTKFEFGIYKPDGRLLLIDELFTHDSSRFVIVKEYQKAFESDEEPRFVDKEPVRKWLESQGFAGDGPVPDLPAQLIDETSDRVIEASELIMGEEFILLDEPPSEERILRNLEKSGIYIPM